MDPIKAVMLWPLRRKLFVFLLLVFLPAFGVLIAEGRRERREELQRAQNDAFLLIQSLAAQQEQLVTTTKTMLTMLAETREVKALDAKACNRLFAEILRRYPFLVHISAATPDGKIFAASIPFSPGINVADREYFKEALQTLDFSAGEYIVGRIRKDRSLSYALPVLDGKGRPLAVIFTAFGANEYDRFVSGVNLPPGYAVQITDRKGIRLFRSPDNPGTPVGAAMSPEGLALISGGQESGFREWKSLDGTTRIYGFRQMYLKKGASPYLYILAGVPRDDIRRQTDLLEIKNLALLGSITGLALFLAILFGNFFIAKPLNLLVEATEQFGAGNLSTRTGMPYASDEMGRLAKSFDEMACLLEKRNAERRQAQEALSRANAELEMRVQERTAELAASTQRLALHRTLSPLATLEWNLKMEVVSWNPAAERIFGYSRQEAMGRCAFDLIIPSSQREYVAQAWQNLLDSKSSSQNTRENRTKDGRKLFCNWYNTVLISDAGEVVGVASLVEDVTENRLLQEQLVQSQKMEAIGRLAGGVAHDFNNLLMVIGSYSELLLEELANERQRHRAEQVLDACRRASDLTRQLLAFSRRQAIAPRILDLNAVVRDMGKMLPRLIGEHIELEQSLATDLKLCKADPTHLEQVILNLAVNARDAMLHGGRLRVETANSYLAGEQEGMNARVVPGRYVMLAISDNGSGMDAATKARIFEPFFTTKELGKGTGLGLSTVYGIVKQNNGYILVESALGRGSTFRVYLPSVDRAPLEPATHEQPQIATRTTATILLVDDEMAVREAGAEFLKDFGYRVIVAASGDQALQSAREIHEKIDVLVTDIVMAGATGPELAQQLLESRPDMHVLYMSGYGGTLMLQDPAITENCLQKPFSFATLAQRIEQVMHSTPQGLSAT